MVHTDLEHVVDTSTLVETQTLVERQFLLVTTARTFARQRRVHAYITLIARKRPKDDPPLDRLGDALVALLDPLEWHMQGHHFGADVEERFGLEARAEVVAVVVVGPVDERVDVGDAAHSHTTQALVRSHLPFSCHFLSTLKTEHIHPTTTALNNY